MDNSDVISFHSYDDASKTQMALDNFKAYQPGRPVICTEYMARTQNSTFEPHMQLMKDANVIAINWGLVSGKYTVLYEVCYLDGSYYCYNIQHSTAYIYTNLINIYWSFTCIQVKSKRSTPGALAQSLPLSRPLCGFTTFSTLTAPLSTPPRSPTSSRSPWPGTKPPVVHWGRELKLQLLLVVCKHI